MKPINQMTLPVRAIHLWMCSILFGLMLSSATAQTIELKGHITDPALNTGLKGAVAMVVKLSDSTLIAFARTDDNGYFKISGLAIDTIQVIFSHYKFGDKEVIIIGNATDPVLDFDTIQLSVKTVQMREVTVYGYKSPVYFKGDTLVYTADSFAVKPDAVVEDLLKKLPGIRVDKDGKIYAQGKAVDQVLVDGDEFFGSDPTIATKNLAANSLESVQVYEKKNENDAGNADSETIQVMNLQLKEEAKKGYFGKIKAGSDFSDFYEGELLMNKFKGKQKLSVFALASNTPRSQFGWEDMDQYGIEDENMSRWEEDGTYYSMWRDDGNSGIPQTLRTGIFFTDQVFKNTKLSLNYSYLHRSVDTKTDEASQYLFTDTTYFTELNADESTRNEGNTLNMTLEQKIDSAGELEVKFRYKAGSNSRYYNETNQFLTSENSLQRQTDVNNDNQSESSALAASLRYNYDFRKRFRRLTVHYNYTGNDISGSGMLYSVNTIYPVVQPADVTDQHKKNNSTSKAHLATISYTEPITNKIKLELGYEYMFDNGHQVKNTFDRFLDEYTLPNDTLSNDFESHRISNRLGFRFIYEVKKYTFWFGLRARQIKAENLNLENDDFISQKNNFLLPYANFQYKFSDNQRLNIQYRTNSRQPGLNQLQPVPDNSNPNSVTLGNPDLLPTFNQRLTVWYNVFKPVSGNSMWTNLGFNTTSNQINNNVYYDSLGRRITQPVNVDGNYGLNFSFNYNQPLFSKLIEVSPYGDVSYDRNRNFVNGALNTTYNTTYSVGVDIEMEQDKSEYFIGGYYGTTYSKASINDHENRPFTEAGFSGGLTYELPFKFKFETDLAYRYRFDKQQNFKLGYYEWNAALSKSVLKKDLLTFSVEAFDILNQNVDIERTVDDNIITDSRANTVRRYILFRVVFKFNSNKSETEESNE